MTIIDSIEHAVESGVSALTNLFTTGETMPIVQQPSTPGAVVAPVVAPVVALPVTGVDPTAAVLPVTEVVPVVEVPNVAPVADVAPVVAGSDTPSTDATASAATATPVVAKTPGEILSDKITAKKAQYVKLAAEIEKLEGQFRAVDLIASVKAGSVIVARIGRAETSKEVEASVLGVQTLESGDVRYKIFFGEGVDAEVAVIQTTQIVDVKTA